MNVDLSTEPWKRSLRASSATPSSSVAIAPPSPRQGRFLEGKNEKVAAAPSAPALTPSRRAPAAWAASSTTGGPSSRSSATGATLPNRCTGDDRLRAGRERRPDGLRGHAEGVRVDVAEDRRRARDDRRLGGRVEGERGHHHLVARPDPERAQGDRQRVGPVGDADAVAHAEVGGELGLERLHLRAEDVAARAGHAIDRLAEPIVVRRERRWRIAARRPSGGSLPYFALMTVLASITDPIVEVAVDVVDAMGLPGVFVLMVLESACIPVPSEATMLFAGFNVSRRRVQPGRRHGGRGHRQPRRLLDRLLDRLRRPRRPAREARPQAARQEEPPGVGRPLVRAPRRRDRLLRAHAADHPHLHLAARGRGAHALLALQRAHASLGCIPWVFMLTLIGQAGRRQLGEVEGQPPLRRLRRRGGDRDRRRLPDRALAPPAPRRPGGRRHGRRSPPDARSRFATRCCSAPSRARRSCCRSPAPDTSRSCRGCSAGATPSCRPSCARPSRWRCTPARRPRWCSRCAASSRATRTSWR